jgi:hypothetical protein
VEDARVMANHQMHFPLSPIQQEQDLSIKFMNAEFVLEEQI